MLGLGELFYQPAGFPLEVAFSGLLGTDEGLEYNADIRFRPSNNFDLNLNSDRLSQRFRANYRALRGISFRASGNTRENALAAGFSFSRSSRNFLMIASADIDTNNNFRWNLNSRLGRVELRNYGNEINTNSQLSYNFSKTTSYGNSLNFNYETSRNNNLAFQSRERLILMRIRKLCKKLILRFRFFGESPYEKQFSPPIYYLDKILFSLRRFFLS